MFLHNINNHKAILTVWYCSRRRSRALGDDMSSSLGDTRSPQKGPITTLEEAAAMVRDAAIKVSNRPLTRLK